MFISFMHFFLASSVKFSQLKYTLLEDQGVISIEVIYIGVPEVNVRVKVLLGNESSSNSTSLGKQTELGICFA